MKHLILLCLSFSILHTSASKTDSTFQSHQLTFAMTNAVSIAPINYGLYGSPGEWTPSPYFSYHTTQFNYNGDPTDYTTAFLPNYTLHLKIEYSIGLSKLIRLETGAGYLIQGLTIKYSVPDLSYQSLTYCYIGNVTMPLHIKFTKAKAKGAFTCTFGPNITFPFHDFYKTTDVWIDGIKQLSRTGSTGFKSFTDNASIGFDFKMGYEKRLNKQYSINIGPAIYIIQLAWVNYHKMDIDGQIPRSFLESFVGIDIALNFGLKK